MKCSFACINYILLFTFSVTSAIQAEPPKLSEAWQSPYTKEDATGKHVIALWQFDAKDEIVKDISGNGHDLKLTGAKVVDGGCFGDCLETARGYPIEDKPHRARAKDHDALSPPGAFSLEMWIMPQKELDKDYPQAFLMDKKYVSHNDYQLILGHQSKAGTRCLSMVLGFGNDSQTYHSRPIALETGKWLHLAFVYDGAGRGEFFINGFPWGTQTYASRKGISRGSHPLVIGDRVGSLYHGFPGLIDQVRICGDVREFRPAKVELLSDRKCFVRMEAGAVVRLAVTNLDREKIDKATLSLRISGPLATTPGATSAEIADKTIELTDLPPGKAVEIDYTLDTSLRPADYLLVARLQTDGKNTFETESRLALSIVPRHAPHRFPVLMWGVHGGILKEVDRLKRIGFNHALGLGANNGMIWAAGKPIAADKPEKVAQNKAMLDEALRHGITVVSSLSPGRDKRGDKRFWRVDPDGKPLAEQHGTHDICPLFDELTKFSHNVGASMAQTYGHFPAYGAALAHTEVRGGNAQPCFHEHDRRAFKKASGQEIPKEIKSKWGVRYTTIKDFPKNRVIDDNNPIYLYYRWFWKDGDGWNRMNSELTRGLKSTGRKDFWVFTDPAVRVASVYGSGGDVDVLSQWTYSYPDPIRIGIATDELLAMAGGVSPKQQVMKMTQIIWYRRYTAPIPEEGKESPAFKAGWEVEEAEAPFITIAPMHLREAFWTKIARPIRGIMYHGYQSLLPCESTHGYRFTNEHTHHELARLVHGVIEPLGPTLLNVPGVKSDVALLESLASQVFAGRGAYGWCGKWSGDAHLVAQYAHLQPDI
ncbi:MAG: LamG domain-containing protein, partial [Pirellulales bacterium]|nr:LamG domain-containing protein [Pirellulales bacterium]